MTELKALYNYCQHSSIHAHIHSHSCKATASWSGAVRVRCLAQGHLNTLGGARLSLPPELLHHNVGTLEVISSGREQSSNVLEGCS